MYVRVCAYLKRARQGTFGCKVKLRDWKKIGNRAVFSQENNDSGYTPLTPRLFFQILRNSSKIDR